MFRMRKPHLLPSSTTELDGCRGTAASTLPVGSLWLVTRSRYPSSLVAAAPPTVNRSNHSRR